MKKFYLVLILAMVLIPSLCFGVDWALKATWTPNTEPDMKEYELYRTDGTRALVGVIPHPPVLPYNFIASAPDGQDYTMTFVLISVDTAGNKSGDSNTAPFLSNKKAPAARTDLGVQQ